MTASVFVANMAWVFLGVNWLLEGRWAEKWRRLRSNSLLHAFMALMLVYLLWTLGSHDMAVGFNELRTMLPLLVVPVVTLSSEPLSPSERRFVAAVYVVSVTVVSLVGLARYATMPGLPYRDIVPTVSHIRFGLNVCLSLCLLVASMGALLRNDTPSLCRHRGWLLLLHVADGMWLIVFLVIIQSYTSFIILAILLLLVLILGICHVRSKRLAWPLAAVVAVIVVSLGVMRGYVNDYYGDCRRDADMVENGSYIYHNIDEGQLRRQWQASTGQHADAPTDNGYSAYSTLIRYLNATGRSKDSAGVASLSASDRASIMRGVANPVYDQHGMRRMVYAFLFEYETYRCGGGVTNFSFLERLELWRVAWHVFSAHPLLGVGIGDVVEACHTQLRAEGSELADTKKSPHNQYLTFLAAFGVVGFTIIMFFFVRAVWMQRRLYTPLAIAYICILLTSFVSENTLDTLAGSLFAAVPWVLLVHPVNEPFRPSD